MKKLLCALLVVLITLSTAGCVDLESTLLYMEIEKKEATIYSYEQNATTRFTLKSQYGEFERFVEYTQRFAHPTDDEVEMEQFGIMRQGDEEFTFTAYAKDGYSYDDVAGRKSKIRSSGDDFDTMYKTLGEELGEELISRFSLTRADNGNATLALTLDVEQINQHAAPYFQLMTTSMEYDAQEAYLTSLYFEKTVDSEYMPVQEIIRAKGELLVDGTLISFTYDSTLDIVSVNAFSRIRFPSDLDTYEEI